MVLACVIRRDSLALRGPEQAAGLTAALIAFCVAAAFDWIWQVPVVPAAFLLLAVPSWRPESGPAASVELVRARSAPASSVSRSHA